MMFAPSSEIPLLLDLGDLGGAGRQFPSRNCHPFSLFGQRV
jgi:hypothetical protein